MLKRFLIDSNVSGEEQYVLIKACLQKNALGGKVTHTFLNRLESFFRVLMLPIFIRFAKKTDGVYFLEPSNSSEIISVRKEFLAKYLGEDPISFHLTCGIHVAGIRDFIIFLISYFKAVIAIAGAFFDRPGLNYKLVANVLMYRCKIAVENPATLIFFQVARLDNYLLAIEEGMRARRKLYYILGNGFMFYRQNYGIYRNITLVCCSKLQRAELIEYQRRKWLIFDGVEIEYWGNEFVQADAKIERKKYKHDIGYYSSGEWARYSDLTRCYDFKYLQGEKGLKTPLWKMLDVLILRLVTYSRDKSLRFCFYLHPLEKELIDRYQLYPPYWDLIDNVNIFVDGTDVGEPSKLIDSRIGISYISSTILNRLNLGLPIYFPDRDFSRRFGVDYGVPRYAMGVYGKYSWSSYEALLQQLDIDLCQ